MLFSLKQSKHRKCKKIKNKKGFAGKIISEIITAGFEISAIQLFTLNHEAAEDFMEVYKGVVPEYHVKKN